METETYNHLTENHPTVDVTVPSSTTSSSAIVSSASSSSSSEPEDSFNYETVFPSLPPTQSDNNNAVAAQHPMFANSNTAKLSIKRPHTTTSVFHIPANERKKSSHSSSFGNETNKKCEEIASRLGVKVEICQSKDQSLHVVISGQEERVQEAKKAIWSEFQTERDYKMKIPREQHKYLIGKAGATLRDLQDKTCTKITVPKAETQSEYVIIHGPKDGIEHAIHEIQSIIDEQMKTSIERLEIPKLYHPWIRGFNNELSNDLAQKYGGNVKINIPPPTLDKDEIVVSGDRDKVELVSAELRRIQQQKSRLNITKLAIQITKSQHKLIIGKNGSNLQEIFRDYDVYVQVPKLDSELETIYLYGEESKLGPALSQVCAKANSVVTVRIDVPSWLHRHMIGEKGANISKITADFPQTRVNFEVDDKIALEGPPDEVEKVRARLENITLGLKQVMVCEEIPIDTKLVPLLIGSKEKKTENHVAKLNKEFGVVVRLPQSSVANENGVQGQNGGQQQFSNVVRIEGAPDAVKKCRVEFIELVKRVENERSKDIIIDQKYHSTLIGKLLKKVFLFIVLRFLLRINKR
jgi:predicted RNA-binding protein Jag